MADGLSIASGVAGLVSLGLTLCNGLHTYFSAIQDRDADLRLATQNLDLLRFNVRTIESGRSKLEELKERHGAAADGLYFGLRNCEAQLRALEMLINELTSVDGLSGTQQKLSKQKMKMRYPFDQKKLIQVKDQAFKANIALSSFVQTFNLHANLGISHDLQALARYGKASDATTHYLLKSIVGHLDAVTPAVQRTEMEIHSLSAQSQELIAMTRSYPGSQSLSPNTETTRFEGVSARAPSAQPSQHDKPLYVQNYEAEQRFCSNLSITKYTCSCTDAASRPAYHCSNRVSRLWGGLVISKEQSTRENHNPGCIFFGNPSSRSSKITLTYSGLLSILSRTLSVSLTHAAGTNSIAFGIQACYVVKSSPAFRLFDNHNSSRCFKILESYVRKHGLEEAIGIIIRELQTIYASGQASPYYVDEYGNNIAHKCLEACVSTFTHRLFHKVEPTSPDNMGPPIDALNRILSYMLDIGVPVAASNFYQWTNLGSLVEDRRRMWAFPGLYRLITNRSPGFVPPELAHKISSVAWTDVHERSQSGFVDTWCKHPDIAEAIGFDDLFLAVMQRNQPMLEDLLRKPNGVARIHKRDLYERNILHFSSGWANGLILLLRHDAVQTLLNGLSSLNLTPLDQAMIQSGIYCSAPNQWTLCYNCGCHETTKLLLEADCSVMISERLQHTLKDCSLRSRRLFFKHLKDRRQRLQDVALACLPIEVLSKYGVGEGSLPDAAAMNLWKELQKRAADLAQRGIEIRNGLKPNCGQYQLRWKGFLSTLGLCSIEGLFSYPHCIEVCDLALEYGFKPFDEAGIPPLLSIIELSCTQESMAYSSWLLRHDLRHDLSWGPFHLSALHRFGFNTGSWMRRLGFNCQNSFSVLSKYDALLSAICCSEAQSDLPCACSTAPFDRPLAFLMSGLMEYSFRQGPWKFRKEVRERINFLTIFIQEIHNCTGTLDMGHLVKCAIHILTMAFLGIRHLPICPTRNLGPGEMPDKLASEECWMEILDEDRDLIDQLHVLDEEFGDEFERQNVSIEEFLRGYWLRRMREVERDLFQPLSDDYRRSLREVGVVLEEDKPNSYEFEADEDAYQGPPATKYD